MNRKKCSETIGHARIPNGMHTECFQIYWELHLWSIIAKLLWKKENVSRSLFVSQWLPDYIFMYWTRMQLKASVHQNVYLINRKLLLFSIRFNLFRTKSTNLRIVVFFFDATKFFVATAAIWAHHGVRDICVNHIRIRNDEFSHLETFAVETDLKSREIWMWWCVRELIWVFVCMRQLSFLQWRCWAYQINAQHDLLFSSKYMSSAAVLLLLLQKRFCQSHHHFSFIQQFFTSVCTKTKTMLEIGFPHLF